MENDLPPMEELMAKYFSGEASPEEIALLSSWVKKDEKNRQTFSEVGKTWDHINKDAIDDLDIEEEWKLIAEKTFGKSTGKTKFFLWSKNNLTSSFLKIAAVFVLLLGSIYILKQWWSVPQMVEISAIDDRLKTQLPDGSTVNLNKGAQISHSEKFTKNRHVRLKGEAEFEVTPDREHPFVVEAGKTRIEAIGTRFYVNNDYKNKSVTVILIEGKIAVYSSEEPENKTILLPGEKTQIVERDNKTIISPKSSNNDGYFNIWLTRSLKFEDEELGKVISLLSKAYNQPIILKNPSLAKCKITAQFEDQSLESVLRVIETTLGLKIRKSQGKVEIDGSPCVE